MRFLKSTRVRVLISLAVLVGAGILLWLHGPKWSDVALAFQSVDWRWAWGAVGINLASIIARSIAWKIVIDEALPPPRPGYRVTFSAFCVGLLANAVLPGRIGELARVAVLNRRVPMRGAWATLVGTVFAHRVFDLVPVMLLILYVLITATIPAWAYTSLIVIVAVGVSVFVFAFTTATLHRRTVLDGLGAVRRILAMARQGLGVMKRLVPTLTAIGFQTLGWVCQLFAVYTAMRAFHIHSPLPAAALVLLVMNVVTLVPLWPGNIGALQPAIAVALKSYHVSFADGIAFGFGLQAIEASVGVGIGLVFLAREGMSFAILRSMPGASTADHPQTDSDEEPDEEDLPERARARVSG
jgi:uncharacterized protein (TIRG00374 family)